MKVNQATANEIISRNHKLFYYIANKHGPVGSDYDTDDLAQELIVKALKAVRNGYDITRGTEATFLSVVSWRALHSIRRRVYGLDNDWEVRSLSSSVGASYFKALFKELLDGLAKISLRLADTVRMLLVTGGDRAAASRRFGISLKRIRTDIQKIKALPIGRAVAQAF